MSTALYTWHMNTATHQDSYIRPGTTYLTRMDLGGGDFPKARPEYVELVRWPAAVHLADHRSVATPILVHTYLQVTIFCGYKCLIFCGLASKQKKFVLTTLTTRKCILNIRIYRPFTISAYKSQKLMLVLTQYVLNKNHSVYTWQIIVALRYDEPYCNTQRLHG